ncbi:hypothetical protein NDU88_003941 [Pleurodeles waltl]|uniref:Uncharacterized protein n=1 Tax=Pleurodeles waltl TaxID=8319 RepID=A0AAV7TPV1_PLEWA|nr:hypothetical protein NDU88_003941 [Pleurodeles waltl]
MLDSNGETICEDLPMSFTHTAYYTQLYAKQHFSALMDLASFMAHLPTHKLTEEKKLLFEADITVEVGKALQQLQTGTTLGPNGFPMAFQGPLSCLGSRLLATFQKALEWDLLPPHLQIADIVVIPKLDWLASECDSPQH